MKVEIPFFGGVVTAIDPRMIEPYNASDSQNIDPEEGTCRVRYGYNNLRSAQTNFSAAYGLEYIQGYNSSNALVEEYVSFETISGTTKPFSRVATSGAPTEITNGGVAVSLNASTWRGFAWNDVSYFTNPNDSNPVRKHTIGTSTSWTTLTPPGSPTAQLTSRITYGQNAQSYLTLSWAGITVGADITYTGNATATNSSVQGTSLYIAHTGTITDSSIKIDLRETTAGNAKDFDWYYCDNFLFMLDSTTGTAGGLNVTDGGFTIDPASLVIEFTNSSGTVIAAAITLNFTYVGANGFRATVKAAFPNKNRGDWGDGSTAASGLNVGQTNGEIRFVTIKYRVTGGSAEASYNYLRVQPITIGGIDIPNILPIGGETSVVFTYSYYNSSTAFESGIAPPLGVLADSLLGAPVGNEVGMFRLGTWLEITGTNGADSDNNRYYVRVLDPADNKVKWKRLATQADSDLTYDVRLTFQERLALTTFSTIGPFTMTGCKFGVPWKGWVAWFYKGGYQNVRHSRVGDPEKQANTELDLDSDLNRGATFSLADNFGDEAENAFTADEVIVICGQNGIYSQQGSAPWNLTPPKKFPGSQGVANAFACARWRDDAGNPVVVFVSKTGDGVYSAPIELAADDRGARIVPIDGDIRGQVRTYLIDGQSALWTALSITADSDKLALIRVWVDESRDALWVACGKRALVLMRPSLVSGKREWRMVSWTTDSSTDYVRYVSSSTARRVRWIRSAGKMDENEWNQTTNAWVTGATRDGDAAAPTAYWTSKNFSGGDRARLDAVWIDRDTLTDTPVVTAYCERQPSGASRTFASGASFVRFSHLQSGWSHKLKFELGANSAPLRRAVMDNVQMAGRLVKTS